MNDLSPLATVVVAALAVCIPSAAAYLLMDSDDDPRSRGRAER